MIEELIRDFTKVGFMPKSEARRRLEEFETQARQDERERVVELLDWRNRTDGVQFHDGQDIVDWIDEKIKTLKQQS